MVRCHGAGAFRQVAETDLCLVQPVLVGITVGQIFLEFSIVNDAALLHVDQEHLARLQAPFLDDVTFRYIQYAHFRGHHHQVILGEQVACRSQAVAVQGCADLTAISEGHGGRAVPRFHQCRMVFVEGTAFFVHQRVTGPGFRDQQHHRMRHGVTAAYQQLQGVVETGRVRLALCNQRPELLQIVTQQCGCHGLAPGIHPVDVAAQRVDLAVMRNHAERMGKIPRRECIG